MAQVLRFSYTNHRGETAIRRITPKMLEFQREPGYGYEPGWFLTGFDLDKHAMRSFSLSNITVEDQGNSAGVFKLVGFV